MSVNDNGKRSRSLSAEARGKNLPQADGDGAASRRRRGELTTFADGLVSLTDRNAMEAILREGKMKYDEKNIVISQRFPRLDIVKAEAELRLFGINEAALASLCDYAIEPLVTSLLECEATIGFVGRFKTHVAGEKAHPFVHRGTFKDGGSAVRRLKKPFGDMGRLVNVCPVYLPYMARLGLLVDPCGKLMVDASDNSIVRGTVDTLTMSLAIRLMLLALIGFTDLTAQSAGGSGLERLVAMKCVLAMTALSDPSELSDALRTAPMAKKEIRDPLGCLKVRKSRTKKMTSSAERLAKNGVALLSLRHGLSRTQDKKSTAGATRSRTKEVPNETYETLSDIRTHVRNGNAVVVLNVAGAPYADVIAIRPGYVGFFQAKDDDDFDPSEECAMLFQANANITEALCGIAGVEPANAGLVMVSQQEERSEGALMSGHRWCVLSRDDDFLFPFRWPACLLRGDHGCRYANTSYTHKSEEVPPELKDGRNSS